ncbi:leucyl aminopeptidase [Gleimia hominis]|uniref:leucyl aminopeptidase n=1 Tax=Gleimia hominis TaxID=595468 RepID=UPI000C80F3F1|nr:leucyl aminopeptidase [Gleimia hominis]WIK64980.1 leucyl aminopeptidase [Gleimia hominis]
MVKINFSTGNPLEISADLLVAYVGSELEISLKSEDVAQALVDLDAKTAACSRTLLPSLDSHSRHIAMVGTTPAQSLSVRGYDRDSAIEVVGTGAHRHYSAVGVRDTGAKHVVLAGDYENQEDVVQAGIGAIVGAYEYTKYRQSTRAALEEITIIVPEDIDQQSVQNRITTLAEAMTTVMDLVNCAPNDLYPQSFVKEVERLIEGTEIDMEVWDEHRLAQENCGAILAVGMGSVRPPRLVKLTYNPGATHQVSFVGKGITFDSGGLSLKPSSSMETMKSDMTGAATVLATTIALAKLGAPIGVTTYLSLAENMPGGGAQRPSDVLIARNGMSVETTNTDAEGRLVMADALALAAETGTEAIVDVATLTGAQMVGLGERTAGVMGSDSVRDAIVTSANQVGEPMWPAPLPSYLKDSLKSNVADMKNSGTRWGGMLVAGIFLQEFVAEKPWGHVDIAGPSYNENSPWGANNKGATGMGLLTLVSWVESRIK